MTRVALLGGSFNPPHVGHEAMCATLLKDPVFDEVWLVPNFKHYLKKESIPFEDRLEMCRRLATPFGAKIRVCEIERHLGGTVNRSLDTLLALKRAYPEHAFFLVIGADILEETERWYRWDEVVALAPPVVFQRQGHAGGTLPAPPQVSSSTIRDLLRNGEPVDDMVPATVLAYIKEHDLYS